MKRTLHLLLLVVLTTGLSAQSLITIPIGFSEEDAEQENELMDVTDNEIDLGWDMGLESSGGFIFRGLPFKKHVLLDSAFITFTVEEDRSAALQLTITIEAGVTPLKFDSVAIDARSLNTVQVDWTVDSASQFDIIRTANIATLLNAQFGRADWEPLKNICFIITPASTEPDSVRNELEVYSFDQTNASYRPMLHIYYSDSSVINGVSDMDQKSSEIVLFPNPARDHVHIANRAGRALGQVSIYTVNGQIIHTSTVQSDQQVITLDQRLDAGYYMIKVVSEDGGSTTQPLIIER